ncbi:glycoside hydrolase family 19, partial [Aggregatibacter actinomycetemcomitans]|nr:glycoside hydrolase family 19 [Aggregatibacter actinomycetemcomitans]MBN6070438.1 glycoside hydrolase family 19 [Aggregatibacter actinomycetemcomitans]MBN6082628.1 glycoside hydrolase family 19 [Aggregatibacter actinomycetemcomitans]MBN6084361.1 glycoside hydrolase family 19 [Aggregatibacter actinomycetemcomitans]
MSEKNKQLQLKSKEHETIEIPQIPNVAYPLKPKNNTNVS